MKRTIMLEESAWMNSQFSIARFYGGVKWNGKDYLLVNKEGITLEELSNPQSPHYVGDGEMAIMPGEPADLVMDDWLPVYRSLGREEFIKLLKRGVSLEEAKSICINHLK